MLPVRALSAVLGALSAFVVTVSAAAPAAAETEPVVAAAPATPTADTAPGPALVLTGATADDWSRYHLADGQLPPVADPATGFRGEVVFRHGGRERAVRVLVAPGARRPAPLLIALHGLYANPRIADRDMRWGAVVRRAGAVLVYGVGTDSSWNAGTCCGRAVATGVDDVGYLDRVRELVAALHPTDPRRTYLAGFSNGAMMAYRYACERPGQVAGVLAVAGTVVAPCRGRTDVAVLHVHGRSDRKVPVAGLAWSSALASPLAPVAQVPRWFGPKTSTKVLPGFAHAWPTLRAGGYDATTAGWAFLQANPRRA